MICVGVSLLLNVECTWEEGAGTDGDVKESNPFRLPACHVSLQLHRSDIFAYFSIGMFERLRESGEQGL